MFLQTANEKVWQVIITTFVDGWMRFTLFSNLSLTKKINYKHADADWA